METTTRKKKVIGMKTIAYAYPIDLMLNVFDQMDREMELVDGLVKFEEGSPTDDEGHVVTYKMQNVPVLFAMIHSNRKVYVLRAAEGMLEPVGDN